MVRCLHNNFLDPRLRRTEGMTHRRKRFWGIFHRTKKRLKGKEWTYGEQNENGNNYHYSPPVDAILPAASHDNRGKFQDKHAHKDLDEHQEHEEYEDDHNDQDDHDIHDNAHNHGNHNHHSSYKYKKLGANQIRILTLRPGTLEELLAVSLGRGSLDHIKSSRALSYVWGNPERVHTITCNESSVQITSDLHEALCAIRLADKKVQIWADAICVNQDDLKERNQQVKHMAKVYSNAREVLVWLGADPNETGLKAFEFAHKLSADEEFSQQIATDAWRPNMEPGLLALRDIASRDWFCRMWTMQEIGLASSALFLCGRSKLRWERLYQAYDLIAKKVDHAHLRLMDFEPSRVVALRWLSAEQNYPFVELLEMSRGRGTTDPRDRVFALMSHLAARKKKMDKENSEILISPDYSKTLDEISMAVAKRLITETGCLDVLSSAENDSCHPFHSATMTPSCTTVGAPQTR